MKRKTFALASLFVFFVLLVMSPPAVWAQKLYGTTWDDILAAKANYDDPSKLFEKLPHSKVIPKEVLDKITYDQNEMKRLWAEVIGFKAPDVVGRIAPGIKPGKYTYQDKEKYPFKELMIPEHYDRFAPGGEPRAGNFPEITVIPTKQYYTALPYAQKTKEYMGKVKQYDDGYLDYSTYGGAFPFPRPAGPFMAQQIMYNQEKRYSCGETYHLLINNLGFNARFEQDLNSIIEMHSMRVEGRCLFAPLGFYDERAKKEGESRLNVIRWHSPRDLFGMAYINVTYDDPDKQHLNMMYIPAIRRVRKMSGTDVQDPLGGQDMCADDGDLFNQKLSRNRYPYEYTVIKEQEFLVPFATADGGGYLTSKGLELRDYEFERRPIWVVELKQKDPNYIYSKRIIYFDKELLALVMSVNYDQKGRLYRTLEQREYVHPESGIMYMGGTAYLDYIDSHSTIQHSYIVADPGVDRENFSLKTMIRAK